MKRFALVLPLFLAAAMLSQSRAQTPAPPQAETPPPLTSSEPETVHSLGYVEGTWQGWRILNGLLQPTEGEPFPAAHYTLWKDPVCFNVYGLSALAKYVVEKRMKEIAAQIGAPVDRRDPCTPNVTIAFTSDPPATLKSIADVQPWLVPGVGFIRNRLREAQPIQAWYADMIETGNGRAVLSDGNGEGDYYYYSAGSLTRLNDPGVHQLGAVTVIVDTRAIMGMELGTLADYFAMITLAETRFTRHCKEVESIANLMQQDCAPGLKPKAITGNDLFLLNALYSTPTDSMYPFQSLRMAGRVRRALEAEAAGDEQKK